MEDSKTVILVIIAEMVLIRNNATPFHPINKTDILSLSFIASVFCFSRRVPWVFSRHNDIWAPNNSRSHLLYQEFHNHKEEGIR